MKEKQKLNEIIKEGKWNYILKQGGMMGILFAFFMFLFDYSGIFGEGVQGIGTYLFYFVFFGLCMGLLGWNSINKKVNGEKKKLSKVEKKEIIKNKEEEKKNMKHDLKIVMSIIILMLLVLFILALIN